MTGLTVTPISAHEKKAIIETGTALCVSPEPRYKLPEIFAALHQHLTYTLLVFKTTKFIQSGYSYYVVIFASKSDRDLGARILNGNSFVLEGREIALTVRNFVESCFQCYTVLRFPASSSDTPGGVMEALEILFDSAGQECPGFKFMKHVVPVDMWAVIFESTVTWLPKQLVIGTSSRPVRKEESLCAVCYESSQGWCCSPKDEEMQLYTVLTIRTRGNEATRHNHMKEEEMQLYPVLCIRTRDGEAAGHNRMQV